MSRTRLWKRVSRKHIAITTVTMLATLAAIVWFLPRQSNFGYEFEEGKPWSYAPLIATYDFPIYKTEREISFERDSVLKDFCPFYEKNEQVASQQLAALQKAFINREFGSIPLHYLTYISDKFEEVYAAGVLSPEDWIALKAKRAPGLRIVSGQSAVRRDTTKVFSTRSAYEYIMRADTAHFSRELLTRCRINEFLLPNLLPDTAKTNRQRADLLATVSLASGMVQSGERIIDRGEIISPQQFKILTSYEKESQQRNDPSEERWLMLAGQIGFVGIILLIFLMYLNLFRHDLLSSPHSIGLLFSLMAVFPILTSLAVTHNWGSIYILPYAITPIFVRIFIDSRTAFTTLVFTLVLSSIPAPLPYEFILMQLVAGIVSIYSLKDLTERAQLLRTAVFVTIAVLLFSLAFDLTFGFTFSTINYLRYIYLCINGALLLFAYPLMYLIERLFGFTSSVSLVELTNINNPVLRKMSKVAQGTFNHSMQVANLAAEVADHIGAKPQLARTGALYHDIGKILNPAFFTENQSGTNPHDSLSEERSAEIIIGHVHDGLRLAEKHHLPKVIRDFISTHHGRGKAKYFYIRYVNAHPGEGVNDELFTYPGPNPFTREQAVVMMCDAVEASSRSLKEYTEESIRNLVDHIVDSQMAEGYFRNCPLTFQDITDAKKVLTESLKTIYHTRISYPEMGQSAPKEERPAHRTGLFGTGLHRTWGK